MVFRLRIGVLPMGLGLGGWDGREPGLEALWLGFENSKVAGDLERVYNSSTAGTALHGLLRKPVAAATKKAQDRTENLRSEEWVGKLLGG